MNFRIKRNFEQRKELLRITKENARLKNEEIDALPDALSDDEWEKAVSEIENKYDNSKLFSKIIALEYKSCKNEWFCNFVKSFGIVNAKRITLKQSEIFMKYGEENHEIDYSNSKIFFVNVGSLFIECKVFSNCGYLTIKDVDM